ncbi:galectin 17 [Engraulis encrasicolus]|uniref:galectin 17 n=1 Tax=Engraulis encrasicolus TaxID=184585 RepID=UPI002FD09C34
MTDSVPSIPLFPWFLFGTLLCSHVNCSPSLISISCGVGQSAVLPCMVLSPSSSSPDQLALPPPSDSPYIQWLSMSETVFERMGPEDFQGEGFEGRADVPQEMLQRGNCSLLLGDARLVDSGVYQSYLVVGQTKVKRKVLLQSVDLVVRDYKLKQTVRKGSDLLLELHTPQAQQVVFQKEQHPRWAVVWSRGGVETRSRSSSSSSSRVRQDGERLIFTDIGWEDEGTYRVMDEHGLALSTVMVSVTETTEPTFQKKDFLTGYSAASSLPGPALCLLPLCALLHHFL